MVPALLTVRHTVDFSRCLRQVLALTFTMRWKRWQGEAHLLRPPTEEEPEQGCELHNAQRGHVCDKQLGVLDQRALVISQYVLQSNTACNASSMLYPRGSSWRYIGLKWLKDMRRTCGWSGWDEMCHLRTENKQDSLVNWLRRGPLLL